MRFLGFSICLTITLTAKHFLFYATCNLKTLRVFFSLEYTHSNRKKNIWENEWIELKSAFTYNQFGLKQKIKNRRKKMKMVLVKLLNSSTKKKEKQWEGEKYKKRLNERHRKNFTFQWYLNVAICTCEPLGQQQQKETKAKKKLNTEKKIIETRQNRQFSMRLTFVVIFIQATVLCVCVFFSFVIAFRCYWICCCLFVIVFPFLLRFVRFSADIRI